ncbi:conjugal transfer protein TraG N-terminal domain-containing protein [Enterovibrio norvegicus]|uniref:Conjugal transfer protein TraG N-terminal domain-containing protein n=1 Tax=Enterovibrio norvegicus TaxID=188144 RepID=A0ABV4L514_9GAMM
MEFYVYGAGAQMQLALNAVATFFNTDTFGSLIELALQLSVVISVTLFLIYRDSKYITRWALIYLGIPTFLISMTADIQIIDKQSPLDNYAVDNVPYVVAIPGWAATTFMHGMTEGVETVFSSTDDESYSASGMTFGSNLYTLTRSANAETVELQRYWRDFYHNCIVGDIRIAKKYTEKDVMQSTDILAFLSSHQMSQIRGLYNASREYRTCMDALPEIEAQFQSEASTAIGKLSTYVLGRESSIENAFLRDAVENSYQDLIGVSQSAVDILKQNMAINMTRWNIESGYRGAAINYAFTSNQMQTTSMWINIGLQAKEFIPMMHAIGVILFVCFGCVIVVIALLPHMTLPVLKNYFSTFFYLATWPMIFTILNAIMMWFLQSSTQGATHGLHGISLSNVSGVDYLNTRYASITGYLMMSTPLIAGALTKGASSMMNSLNYQLAGMINQTNARASAAASTGDISHGNTQFANHSFNNANGNKLDTSTLLKDFGTTTQSPNGMMTTQYRGGQTVYDTNPTSSNFQWQVASSSQYSEAVQDLHTDARSHLSNQQSALTDASQTGSQHMANWQQVKSRSEGYGLNHSSGGVASASQGLDKIAQATQSVSDSTGWSYEKANAYLNSVYGGYDAKLGIDALGSGINASTGQKWTSDDRTTLSNLDRREQSEVESAIESFRAGVTQTVNASNSLSAEERKTDVGSYAAGFSQNFGQTQQFMNTATQAMQDVETLSRVNSLESRDMASMTENLVIPFQQFVEDRHGDTSQRILTGTDPIARQERANEWDAFKQSDEFKSFVLSNVPGEAQFEQGTVQKRMEDMNHEEWADLLKEQAQIEQQRQVAKDLLDEHGRRGGTQEYYDPQTRDEIVDQTRERFNANGDQIPPR